MVSSVTFEFASAQVLDSTNYSVGDGQPDILLVVANAKGEETMGETQRVDVEISPELRYSEYKKMYNPKHYRRSILDKYDPVLNGIASFVIPGFGEALCGEFGEGAIYFAGSVACTTFAAIGAGLLRKSFNGGSKTDKIYGIVLLTIGFPSALAVDICSIVNSVRMSKVKNMYYQDRLKSFGSDVSIKLHPYISATGVSGPTVESVSLSGLGNQKLVAGATLRISF